MRLIIFVSMFLALHPAFAASSAIDLDLKGDQFWAVLASRQDADQAVAAGMKHRDNKVMVVKSANGWFAAISGPYSVKPGTGRQFLDSLVKDHGIPRDAYLTRGASFTNVVWTPPATNVLDTLSYDGEHDASMHKDDLDVKLSRQAEGKDQFAATATATYKGKPAFKIAFSDNASEKPASELSLVRLDPSSPMPQVVFTYFWQGAHCCTMTKIATLNKEGVWHIVDGDTLDGDGGYSFEDLENKGFSYLVSSDQSFYYAFDSYASSVAPIEIHRLQGDGLIDVTKEMSFRSRVLQSLYLEESFSTDGGDDSIWHSNGFLAGWVATSMLVGRAMPPGPRCWPTMIINPTSLRKNAASHCRSTSVPPTRRSK
jgi:serine protease Do